MSRLQRNVKIYIEKKKMDKTKSQYLENQVTKSQVKVILVSYWG